MSRDVIDDLQLKISANSSDASRKINNTARALDRMATSLANVAKNTNALNGLSNSLVTIGNTDASTIKTAVNQLRRLSKLNFDNLKGVNLSVNINPTQVQAATKSISSLSKAVSNTSGMKSRLSALGSIAKSTGTALSVGFNKAASTVRKSISIFNGKLDELRKRLSMTQTVAYSVRAALATLIGFHGLSSAFNWLKESVIAGGDITEIDHIVESVFAQNMVGYVHEWANEAIESFGIAEAQAKQYAGTLSSMFQASGVGAGNAGKMAMDLVGLAGDLSAFYNTDTATAYEKIRSGLSGMVRPLRSFGIDLSAASLEEFRLAQGIETSYSAMSQAEKVMLRYQYLMARTTTQQGDFERTQYSLANATRTLKANMASLSTQIGVGLAAAIRPAIVALNQLMKYLIAAARAFATFMQTIFGKYKGGASGIAMEGLEDSADYADDLADGAGSAADGLEDAADAAKQLKKDLSVLPFDELNQLNKDRQETSSGSGSGGAGDDLGDALDGLSDLELDLDDMIGNSKLMDAISKWGDRIKANFMAQDWESLGNTIARMLNAGIDKVYKVLDPKKVKEKVAPYIDAFTTAFNSLVDNLDWDKLGRAIGRGINDIVFILDRLITGIDWKNLGRKLASGANGLVSEVDFRAVGKLIGDKFMIVWNTLYGFAKDFDWKNLGKKLGEGINGLNEAIEWSTVATAITDSFNGIFDALRQFTLTVNWKDIADNIVNGLNTAIQNFNWYENGKSLGMFIENLCDTLIDIIDRTDWEGFGRGLALALQQIPWKKVLKVVGKVIVDVFGGILQGMSATPAGKFAAGLIGALAVYKISTSTLGVFVGNLVDKLCLLLTGKTAMDKLSGAFGKLVSGGLTGITTASAGAAVAIAGVSTAGIILIRNLAQLSDAARGGNGALSEMGTGMDEFIAALSAGGKITEEQATALFNLKEEQESYGASASDVAETIIQKLMDYGVTAEDAKKIADELIYSGQGQTTMFEELSAAAENAGGSYKVYAGDMNMASTDAKTAIGDIRTALTELMGTSEENSDVYYRMLQEFDSTIGSAETAQGAYGLMKNSLEIYGGSLDEVNEKLMEHGYKVAEDTRLVVDADSQIAASAQVRSDLTTEAMMAEQREYKNTHEIKRQKEQEMIADTIEAANRQADALTTWQNSVSEFHKLVVDKLEDIGQEWGTLDAEQEEAIWALTDNINEGIEQQKTALANMQALADEKLPPATVEAILAQVDPSSQAMTDLIQHMQDHDAEWERFHSSLEESLDMKDNIQTMADQMTTEYAKKLVPTVNEMAGDTTNEFLKLEPTFSAAGGKCGGFTIDGVVKGVYDSTDKAVGEMKTLAYNLEDGFIEGIKTKSGDVEKSIQTLMDDDVIKKANEAAEIHSPSRVFREIGINIDKGLIDGLQCQSRYVVNEIKNIADNMKSAMTDMPDSFKKYGLNMANSLKTELEKISATIIPNVFTSINTVINRESAGVSEKGRMIGERFTSGLEGGFRGATSAVNSVIYDIRSGMSLDLYDVGRSAGQSFAEGFQNVHVPTPHIYVSNWNLHEFGDGGYMYTPDFSVQWYKAGGLFKGGKGTMIGIAESNRDEAVIPLEDHRAMQRIGNAIVDAGGNEGSMSELAREIAEVIITTQTQQSDPIFHIEVKTEDNETLARAVTRGQQSIDYRNNPTPAYGY